VKMCVRHGVDVIYHASYIDDVSLAFHLLIFSMRVGSRVP
jgi:hypothetical protein